MPRPPSVCAGSRPTYEPGRPRRRLSQEQPVGRTAHLRSISRRREWRVMEPFQGAPSPGRSSRRSRPRCSRPPCRRHVHGSRRTSALLDEPPPPRGNGVPYGRNGSRQDRPRPCSAPRRRSLNAAGRHRKGAQVCRLTPPDICHPSHTDATEAEGNQHSRPLQEGPAQLASRRRGDRQRPQRRTSNTPSDRCGLESELVRQTHQASRPTTSAPYSRHASTPRGRRLPATKKACARSSRSGATVARHVC